MMFANNRSGAVIIALCLLWSLKLSAQVEVSSGIDLHCPVLLNKYNNTLFYSQQSFGLRAGIAYKPEQTQFFPILNVSIGRTRLPLIDFDKNVAVFNYNYANLLLNENYIVHLKESELYIYGGIGFSYLTRKSLKITGSNGESMESAVDSMKYFTNFFPAVNIGFEFNDGRSAGKPLYLTFGVDFQYLLLLSDRNEYFITVKKPGNITDHYHANLAGNVISPGIYVAIHYLLGHKI